MIVFSKSIPGCLVLRRNLSQGVLPLVAATLVAGCVSFPGNSAVGIGRSNQEPKREVETVRGVINGLHKYDPQQSKEMMTKFDEHLSTEEVQEFSDRYMVKVGIDREPVVAELSPIVLSKWASYVVLPEGWSYSVSEISEEDGVVNVGDIVDIELQKGRRYDFAIDLVRKCFEEPAEDENPDWDIGCKTYEGFGEKDFVGEYYSIRQF